MEPDSKGASPVHLEPETGMPQATQNLQFGCRTLASALGAGWAGQEPPPTASWGAVQPVSSALQQRVHHIALNTRDELAVVQPGIAGPQEEAQRIRHDRPAWGSRQARAARSSNHMI